MTQSGWLRPIKWIGRRRYDGRFVAADPQALPIIVRAGALGGGVPVRDLCLSPHHALWFGLDSLSAHWEEREGPGAQRREGEVGSRRRLPNPPPHPALSVPGGGEGDVRGVLVPVEHLVNGVSIVQCPAVECIDYFHIELATHDVVLAEGTPAETFVDCDSRQMFHNAHEFALLDAGEAPARWAFCAPRLEDEPEVAELWRRFALRAGLDPAPGPLAGYLDVVEDGVVRGWARDCAHPEMPVVVEIVVAGAPVGRVLANRYRPDLWKAGLGHGRHGFRFVLPQLASADWVAVRRAGDGARLRLAGRRRRGGGLIP